MSSPFSCSATFRVFLIVLLIAQPAFAYLDPGTASLLFQAGYFVVASIGAALAFFFRPIKLGILKMMGKLRPADAVSSVDEEDNSE